MKVMLSLRYGDLKEIMAGVVAILRTLGWVEGPRAIGAATWRQLAVMWRGEGLYPEAGKQRVWFKLHFLKLVYDYLEKTRSEDQARALFVAIARAPTAAAAAGNMSAGRSRRRGSGAASRLASGRSQSRPVSGCSSRASSHPVIACHCSVSLRTCEGGISWMHRPLAAACV